MSYREVYECHECTWVRGKAVLHQVVRLRVGKVADVPHVVCDQHVPGKPAPPLDPSRIRPDGPNQVADQRSMVNS